MHTLCPNDTVMPWSALVFHCPFDVNVKRGECASVFSLYTRPLDNQALSLLYSVTPSHSPRHTPHTSYRRSTTRFGIRSSRRHYFHSKHSPFVTHQAAQDKNNLGTISIMYQSYGRGYWGGGQPQQEQEQEQEQRRQEEEEEAEEEEQQQQHQQQQHPSLASSLFESNAFYNLGRVLSMEQQQQQQQQQQGGGDTEGEVYYRGFQYQSYHHQQNFNVHGLADSAPVPPVQRATTGWGGWGGGGGGAGQEEQQGEEVVEERDGSYLVCSIRPQVKKEGEVREGEEGMRIEECLHASASSRNVCDVLSSRFHPPSVLFPLS